MQRVYAVAMMLVCAMAARAASFDCKLAKTAQEKAICASPSLSKADEDMAGAYKAMVAAFPAEAKPELLAEQRAWLKGLARQCKAGTKDLAGCLEGAYKARIEGLKGRVVTMGGVTFLMYGTELTAKDADDESSPDIRAEEQNPGFGTLDAQWPVATAATPEWKAWNVAVEQEAQKLARTDEKEPVGAWKSEWAGGMESQVTATMLSVGDGRVSVHLEDDIMGHGAAHPSEIGENFHWLLKEQRELRVDDLFVSGPGWSTVVNAACVAALKKQFGPEGMAYDDIPGKVAEVTASTKNWALSAKGLVISFPEYSVSPRAAPAEDVVVPWSDLAMFLKAGSVVQQ